MFAVLGTALTTLSSFTEITVNTPELVGIGGSTPTGRSVVHCLFAQIEIVVGGIVIKEAAYPTWEACRDAKR